jgi:hypothetical protein
MIAISPLDFQVGEYYVQEIIKEEGYTSYRIFICSELSTTMHYFAQTYINPITSFLKK